MDKQFTPETLRFFRYLSWPQLSEDAQTAAYVLKTADEQSGLFIPQVHLRTLQTGETQTLCAGTRAPYFVQNGKAMTYISNESGEDQVYLRDFVSGQTQQLTSLRHGVTRYRVSPDGTKLVFEATLWPQETEQSLAFTPMSPEEKLSWNAQLDMEPYTATELVCKMDEWYGMRKGEFAHIGILHLANRSACVLPIGMEAIYPSLSPDGTKVAFLGYPYHDARGHQVELFVWDIVKESLEQISSGSYICTDHSPIFTADGSGIIVFAYGGSVGVPYLYTLSDKSCRTLIAQDDDALCHGVHPLIANKTENGENDAYAYLTDSGRTLTFLSARNARQNLYRIPLEPGSRVEQVLAGDSDLQAFHVNADGRVLSLMGDLHHPAELYMDGKRLTAHNAWLNDYPQGDVQEFWIRSRDGKVNLQYFLIHPVHQQANRLYPAVLDIKGGPTTMYAAAYWHEFHALSAAGFAVIVGNPRGSVGFGEAFCEGAVCWQNESMNDLEDMLADALSKGFIDPKRLGVTGGSYGGYMTNKLIGRTKHFTAAVTQRSLVNPATSYGTGDMGFISARDIPQGFKMLEYLEDRARGNPLTYVDSMKTPLLILHAFRDYRCSFEQGEQLFIAMKERNPEVPCRLVMFPQENHALTRTGKLHSQIQHLSEMVSWFRTYLNKEEESHA